MNFTYWNNLQIVLLVVGGVGSNEKFLDCVVWAIGSKWKVGDFGYTYTSRLGIHSHVREGQVRAWEYNVS